jgi:hypothetical protein
MAVGIRRVVVEATVSVVQHDSCFSKLPSRHHVQELSVALYQPPNIRASRSENGWVTLVIQVGD